MIKTSVLVGICFHVSAHGCPRSRLKAQLQNSGCHGDPYTSYLMQHKAVSIINETGFNLFILNSRPEGAGLQNTIFGTILNKGR